VVKDKRELHRMVPLPETDGGKALRRRGQGTIIDADQEHNDIRSKLMAHFICAGTSALILSIAHVHPEYWFLSLFALVPLLWRLNRTTLAGSILLGVILACLYAFVTFIGEAAVAPGSFLLNLLLLSLVFSTFGIVVNGVRKYIGFSPIFVAATWVPLEYFLIKYPGMGGILTFPTADSSELIRFASLFGILMISFFIMLVNSIILMLIEYASRIRFSNVRLRFPNTIKSFPLFESIRSTKRWEYFPNLRAPPVRTVPASWKLVGIAHGTITSRRH
jgi:apolipoprotein N-acyltransferase